MTSQSGSGSTPAGTAGGALAGTYPSPTLAAGQVPGELGYASATATQGIPAATPADATSLSLTVTVGTRAVLIEADIPACHANAGTSAAQLRVVDVTASNTVIQLVTQDIDTAGARLYARLRVTPAAGSRQYKVQLFGTAAFTLDSSATSVASLHIREV